LINLALQKNAQEAFCNRIIALPTNTTAIVDQHIADRVPARLHLHLVEWPRIVPQMPSLAAKWNDALGF